MNRTTIDLLRATHIEKFLRGYRMEYHAPVLVKQWQSINFTRPRHRDVRLFWRVVDQLEPYINYHHHYPFPVAPSAIISHGDVLLGHQLLNEAPVCVSWRELSMHGLFCSQSGGGKTTMVYQILDQALAAGINVIIIDPKADYENLLRKYQDMIVLDRDTPFNLFERPSFMTLESFNANWTTTFSRALWGGELKKQILTASIEEAFEQHSKPTLEQLNEIIGRKAKRGDTFQKIDSVSGNVNRLNRISQYYPGLFKTAKGIPVEELLRHSLYIPVLQVEEIIEFIVSYLVHLLFYYNRARGLRNKLNTLVAIDEGLLLWNKQQNKIEGAPLLSYLQSMVREFGIGMLVTTTNLTLTDPVLRSNTNLYVFMSQANGEEVEQVAKTVHLSPEAKEHLAKRLPLGHCLIRNGQRWGETILAKFKPLDIEKSITPAEYQQAKDRIKKYLPESPPAAETEPATSAPVNSVSPPVVPSPVVDAPRLHLNEAEDKLLPIVCKRLLSATQAYHAAGLSAQAGTDATAKLKALGCLTSERVVIKPGRGGMAVVLWPTAKAYKYLNIKPPKGTRGGDSRQHQYLVRAFVELIPESHAEMNFGGLAEFGGKTVDIFFQYREGVHRPLHEKLKLLLLQREGFTGLVEDQGVAIEVECSHPGKTGPENAHRNAAVGVSLTIVAVMPGQLESATEALLEAPQVVCLDALRFLQALREAYASR
jgi:hypothetical protein